MSAKIDDKIEKIVLVESDFRSNKEYEAAKRDLAKIKEILRTVDMNNPKHVAKLYMLVRYKKFEFSTETMRSMFMRYLSDKISAEQIDNNNSGTQNVKTVYINAAKRSKGATIFGSLCIVASLVLICIFFYEQYLQNVSQATALELRELYHRDAKILVADDSVVDLDGIIRGSKDERQLRHSAKEEVRNTALIDLFSINRDIVGWIEVEGTGIDYPIMQSTDNDYYLNHNFYGNSDNNGSIFMDYRNVDDYDTNLLLYGHNMKNGSMFGELTNYKQKEYYEQHKKITVNTLNDRYTYRIIAVCLGEVAKKKENTFRYYNFTNADTSAVLDSFFVNIKAHSIYTVDYNLEKTDHFLTLSTCNSYTDNGRLYVVAVREE